MTPTDPTPATGGPTEEDREIAKEIAEKVYAMWTDRDPLLVAAELGLAAGRAEAAREEREECAKVAEKWTGEFYIYDDKGQPVSLHDAVQIAAAIRTRGA